jgi:hypothetical protein
MRIKTFLQFIILFLFMVAGVVFIHETIHGQIYNYYGCENVTYGVEADSLFSSGFYTSADCGNIDYRFTYDIITLAHSINEIVAYQVTPYLVLIFFAILLKE